ncbi:MAG: DUF2520 domain-containing protein [Syntrophobacterales bacterium]|jgi:predicted short-subunit dehydrogenase-like oxidoreductase (DUF2520 family)|nr:DUF2520 domain-containing protein [Syntrophobacterales bacterium]
MKIGIIGAGKVGTALAYSMKKKGLHISAISDVSRESLSLAERYLGKGILYTVDNTKAVNSSDVIAVTTQDREIGRVAEEIYDSPAIVDGKLFFHTSGARPSSVLTPLDGKGAILGSLHPLQTFPDIESAICVLPSTYIFIEGAASAIKALTRIGESIGCKVVIIEGSRKVFYHLSAVFVCNLLCALFHSAESVMDRADIGLEPFYPIINATIDNIERAGPLASLTGPVIRGDMETVHDHLKAIADMGLEREVYRALSLVALGMARKRNVLDEELLKALEVVLRST